MIHIYNTTYKQLLNKTFDCINVYGEEIQEKSHENFSSNLKEFKGEKIENPIL